MKNGKRTRAILTLLLAGSFLAALKCIFIGLQVDEEYAVSMAYRKLLGDRLFAQLWDPHQTSAFLAEFMIWLYIKLFHTTTGVVIWIRFLATLIHGGIAYGVYRAIRNFLPREYSFYLGILYFNLLPKGYMTPEFSNMLGWMLTLLLLALLRLERQNKPWIVAESGLWMCLMVLSYPSAVLLFPFVLWYLWKQEGGGRRNAVIFAGTCLLGGCGYLAYLFSYMSPEELFLNLQYLLRGNGGHTSEGILVKSGRYLQEAGLAVIISACCAALACLTMRICKVSRRLRDWYLARDKDDKRVLFLYLVLAFGVSYQMVHWVLMGQEYEYSYIYTVYFILFGFVLFFIRNMENGIRQTAGFWVRCNLLMFLAVLALTVLNIFTSIRYASCGVVMGLAALVLYSKEKAPYIGRKFARGLLLFWCFAAIFIKGWEYRDNDGRMENVTCVRGIVSEGPAKGLITQYMLSYMQESTYAEMQQYVRPGDSLLLLDSGGTLSYLFQDVEVASYTTICGPVYDDVLLKYWELNPEKYPDVIAVQCWYGELHWDRDSWIMRWIEENFDAAQVTDGKYFRYYIAPKR